MAGPQDYLTVKGPEGASYSLPKFDLGSQIASIPTSYQEGQQYGVKRALQTAFKDGFPTDQQGNPDYNAMATRLLAIGGPEAAQPYFQLGMQQNNAGGWDQPPQPQTQPGQPSQTPRPAPNAATPVAGPDNIRGTSTASTGDGSIFPYPAGTSPPKIVSGGLTQSTGAGTTNQPPPYYGNRTAQSVQQNARPGMNFNDRVAQNGGMSNRPSATEDGSTGQPTTSTSSRETANNGASPNDPQISQLMARASQIEGYLRRPGLTQGQAASGEKALGIVQDALKARMEFLNKNAELTTGEKEAKNPSVTAAAGAVEAAKTGAAADTKYYDTVYRGLTGSATIAAQQKQNIALLRQIAESPNFMPGMGSELALGYQRLAAQFGINPTGAAPREVFNQLAARVLADQFSGMKSLASETGEQGARIFKPMLDIEERANITPNDSLEGVRAKLNLLDRSGDLMMRYGDMADDYKTSHGKLDASFNKTIRAEIAGSRMGAVMPAASGAIQVAPAGQKSKAEVLEWASKVGLKSGDPFRTPTGAVRYIP